MLGSHGRLYITFLILSLLFVLLPVWAVKYLFVRPRPTWSWRYAMAVAIMRHMSAASEVELRPPFPFPDHSAIWPASDVEGVWMDGVPHLITAELEIFAAIANVEPARIPGYWYGKKGALPKPIKQTSPRQRVFLYLHGGAFIYGSAHPKDLSSYISRSLVELSDDVPHVLAVEYRLSSIYPHPRHPFPAALLDSLAGYNYLVNVMGYNPSDIIVAGDSAGGNLALALVRYLIENNGGTAGTLLPAPPGHLLLISPCPDLSNSHAKPGSAAVTYDMDLLSDRYTGKRYPPCGLLAYLGPFGLGMAVRNRYVSPVCLDLFSRVLFTGFPRTFIVAGGAERLLDQIHTLRDRMVKDIGEGQVTYYEAADSIHDYLLFPFCSERADTFRAIGNWLR